MGRALKIALLAWFGLLLGAPLVLYLAGERPGDMENRTLAPQPDITPRSLANIETYRRAAIAFSDRLPFRDRVIRQRGRLAYELLGDSPVSQVLVGRDRWLFLRDDLVPCSDPVEPEDAASGLDLLRAGLAATGRDLRVLVVPSKTWIEREHYGRVLSADACARERGARLEAGLHGVPGALDLWGPFRAAKAAGDDVFISHDSHTGPVGTAITAGALVQSLDPAAWASGHVGAGPPAPRPGDLANLMGLGFQREAPTLAVEPPTQTIATPTFVIGDSQFQDYDAAAAQPFFQSLTSCTFDSMYDGTCDPAPLVAARTIVVETVERFALTRGGTIAGLVLAALAAELPGAPAAWASPDGAALDAAGQLLVPGPANVALAPSAGDDPGHWRLLRFAVPAAADGSVATLSRADFTPLQGPLLAAPLVGGGTVTLAVPPGVAVADTRLQVAATGAVTLAPPTLVDLGPSAGG